jgi:hypothetical protein
MLPLVVVVVGIVYVILVVDCFYMHMLIICVVNLVDDNVLATSAFCSC